MEIMTLSTEVSMQKRQKSPRGKKIACITYYTFPSLFVFTLTFFAGMSFWPKLLLIGATVIADGLRLLGALSVRVENGLSRCFSGRMPRWGYRVLFLIYPAICLVSLVPYFFMPDLCIGTVNTFIEEYFPGAWRGIHRIGPPCQFHRGFIVLSTSVLLQVYASLTIAICSFLNAVSSKDYYYNFLTRTSIPIYCKSGAGIQKIYHYQGAKFFFQKNSYLHFLFFIIIILFFHIVYLIFPHNTWIITPIFFHEDLIFYIILYMCGGSLMFLFITGGFILLSESSLKPWYPDMKVILGKEEK